MERKHWAAFGVGAALGCMGAIVWAALELKGRERPQKYHEKAKSTAGQECDDCVICLSAMDKHKSDITFMPCGHALHEECYEQYIQYEIHCPLCRNPLSC